MLSLLIPIALGGGILSLWAGPTGCLLIWSQSTPMAEGLSHGLLLGCALHLFTGWPRLFCLCLPAWGLATIFAWLKRRRADPAATIQLLSAGFCALGALGLQQTGDAGAWEHALFGQLLGIGNREVIELFLMGVWLLASLVWSFPNYLRCLHEPELAQLEGLAVRRIELGLQLWLATASVVALNYFGGLLGVTLLVAPAEVAQSVSRSPEQAMALSAVMAFALILVGLVIAVYWDLQPSATICLSALTARAVSEFRRSRRER